ncbi:hypothetical protein [Mesorhizobium sp. M0589]|uniref:hypothetical protein n=1 Tax=Mesorhizobium sp. M0589 TaxID=2956965 RepID=UPI0033362342
MTKPTSGSRDDTKREFEDAILSAYYRGRAASDRESQEVDGLIRRRGQFEKLAGADPELFILHRCANIAASWLSFIAAGIVEEFADEENEGQPLDEQVAGLAFFSRLANDLWAIIELVEIGFDLQARALTRGFLEHVDVLICCTLDREVTTEFVGAIEPDAANQFWHRHVSKNKAKAKVSTFIAGELGRQSITIVDLLREDAELAASELLHPTVTAGLSTAFGHPDGEYESYGIFPLPLAASVGVFRSILIHLLWLSFAMGGQPRYASWEWLPLFQTERLKRNEEIERFGSLYRRMFGFLLDHQLLMHPDDDGHQTED